MLMLKCRSLNSPSTGCLRPISLLLLPPSPMWYLIEVFMCWKWWLMMILLQPKPSLLRTKLKFKTAKIARHSKSRERKWRTLGERGLPRPWEPPKADHGGHHGPWKAPQPSRGGCYPASSLVSQTQHFGSRLGPRFLPWICRIRSIRPHLLAFLNPFCLNFILLF